MERIKNIYEVTQRLCGDIQPVGETTIDSVRYQNLVDTIRLTAALIEDIILVASYKNCIEYSMYKAGFEADDFIKNLIKRLNNEKI